MENQSGCYCTNCGSQMLKEAEICTSCGVRQGKVINYCYNCSGDIKINQELCLNCGVNPKRVTRSSITSAVLNKEGINLVLVTILGYLIPGIPSIIWFNQKKKGFTLLGISILCLIVFPVLGNILFGVFTAVDAYQIGKRMNQGEIISEWTFFWDK